MSFKSFSTSQNTPAKDSSDDKPKAVAANDQPDAKSDAASSESASASKS